MRLAGRVVLITGGAKRIGRALALAFAHRGATIAFTYNTSGRDAQKLLSELRRKRHPGFAVRADQSDVDQIHSAVGSVEKRFGRIDLLINSASNFYPTPLATAVVEDWDSLVNVNLRAPFFYAQAVAPGMLKRKSGKIINMADVSAFNPWKEYLPYCAAKAGVVALTQGLAKALAPHVQVNAIAPGPILPPPGLTKTQAKRALEKTLLKRWGSPEDIVQTALYLTEGTDFVTGQIVAVDGGRLLS